MQIKYKSRCGWPFAGNLCSECACIKCDVTKASSLKQPAALSVTCWINACSPLTFLPFHLLTPLLTDSSVYAVSNGPWPHTVKASRQFHAKILPNFCCFWIISFCCNLILTINHLNNFKTTWRGCFLIPSFLHYRISLAHLDIIDPVLLLLKWCFQVHVVFKVQSWLDKSVLLIDNDAVSKWKRILELLRGTIVFQPWTFI